MEPLPILNNAPPVLGNGGQPALLKAPEKAAVILALLGPEHAGPVVEKIKDEHLRAFMNALENLKLIPRESMLTVVADFITELQARRGGLRGGAAAARELAESLFETERAARLFGKAPAANLEYASSETIWAELRIRKIPDIAAYLSRQRSAVISIVLSQFSSEVAGEILSELPEELSVLCVRQMSRGEKIDDRTLAAVAELIQTEFLAIVEADDEVDSVDFVSEILGILPKDRRDMMLDSLDEADPEQAKLIRKRMLTFEDLPKRLPTTAIPIIFKDIDTEILLKALKAGQGQAPDTVEFLYANISQRMAGQYKEQVEELAAISQKEADAAISTLMGFIGRLEKQGRVTLIKLVSEDAGDA